jgi:hypothetical protein
MLVMVMATCAFVLARVSVSMASPACSSVAQGDSTPTGYRMP